MEFVITEIKRDLELKLAEIKRDLELKITENKNNTDIKLKDTDIKIERMRTEAEKNKNTLLFWGVTIQLAVGGLVITLLQFLRT